MKPFKGRMTQPDAATMSVGRSTVEG